MYNTICITVGQFEVDTNLIIDTVSYFMMIQNVGNSLSSRPITARACGVKEPIIIEVVAVQSPHITLGCRNNFRSPFPFVLFELLLSSLCLLC